MVKLSRLGFKVFRIQRLRFMPHGVGLGSQGSGLNRPLQVGVKGLRFAFRGFGLWLMV